MDIVHLDAVLRALHRVPVLPEILHPGAGWRSPRFGGRAYVGSAGHLSHAGRRCVRETHRSAGRRHRGQVLRLLLPCMADR